MVLVAHQVVLVRNLLQLLVLALHQALVGQPQPLVLPQVPQQVLWAALAPPSQPLGLQLPLVLEPVPQLLVLVASPALVLQVLQDLAALLLVVLVLPALLVALVHLARHHSVVARLVSAAPLVDFLDSRVLQHLAGHLHQALEHLAGRLLVQVVDNLVRLVLQLLVHRLVLVSLAQGRLHPSEEAGFLVLPLQAVVVCLELQALHSPLRPPLELEGSVPNRRPRLAQHLQARVVYLVRQARPPLG